MNEHEEADVPQTDWRVHWAHVDGDGNIITWGTSLGLDVFLQPLENGLTAIARPEQVNGLDGWRLVGDAWVQQEE